MHLNYGGVYMARRKRARAEERSEEEAAPEAESQEEI